MNRNFFIAIFIALLQYICITNASAQASIETKTDATQIVLGDQVRYFITATVDTSHCSDRA